MRVGLYLAYSPPNKKMSLKQEGLGRYLAELIRAFINNGDDVIVACPNWVVDSVEELMDDFGIEKNKIQYLLPKGESILYRLYLYKILKIKKTKKRKKIKKLAIRFIDRAITIAISLKNVALFSFLVFLTLIAFLLLMPLWVLLIIIMLGFKILQLLNSKTLHFSKKVITKPHIFIIEKLQQVKPIHLLLNYIKTNYDAMIIQEKIRISSAEELIRHINHAVLNADIWYCPMAFWPEFNQISGKKVICIPDVVTGEFSENFSKYDSAGATEKVRKTICGGTYFITYCNYIKETLVEQYFGKKRENIAVIPHAINETLPYINIQGNFVKKLNTKDPVMRFAKTLLPNLIDKNINMREYLGGNNYRFAFENVKYIFYPSQIRGNKNILTLVKAYKLVLRKYSHPIKLFLTCNYVMDKELTDYIYDHNLQYDVLSFFQVTNQQLAALYKCAELVVNPTLYEGGFPFTFGEGMSVGTPSIMSDIPQVREETQNYELSDMLFDPYDHEKLAEKIVYGLENRSKLIEKETPLYQKMCKRDWKTVGQEYINVFKKFAS